MPKYNTKIILYSNHDCLIEPPKALQAKWVKQQTEREDGPTQVLLLAIEELETALPEVTDKLQGELKVTVMLHHNPFENDRRLYTRDKAGDRHFYSLEETAAMLQKLQGVAKETHLAKVSLVSCFAAQGRDGTASNSFAGQLHRFLKTEYKISTTITAMKPAVTVDANDSAKKKTFPVELTLPYIALSTLKSTLNKTSGCTVNRSGAQVREALRRFRSDLEAAFKEALGVDYLVLLYGEGGKTVLDIDRSRQPHRLIIEQVKIEVAKIADNDKLIMGTGSVWSALLDIERNVIDSELVQYPLRHKDAEAKVELTWLGDGQQNIRTAEQPGQMNSNSAEANQHSAP